MKNYIKLKSIVIQTLGVLFLVGISYSCDDLVDESPISTLSDNNFWLNNDDAISGVMAIYDGLQKTYGAGFNQDRKVGSSHMVWGELRSDNFEPFATSATAESIALPYNELFSGHSSLRWNNLFESINRANQAIDNIPKIIGADQNLLAEAHALRAMLYFDAVRIWGNVPLFNSSDVTPANATRPATDAATILSDLIVPDVLRAEELMTIQSREFRISLSSIYCLQAEVYMWLKEYGNAKIALDKLVGLGTNSLVNTPEAYENLFLNDPVKVQTGPELIFSIAFQIEDPNDRTGIFALYNGGIRQFHLSTDLENKWRAKFPVDETEWNAKYPTTPPVATSTELVSDGMGGFIEVVTPAYGDWRYFMMRKGGVDFTTIPIGEALLYKWGKGDPIAAVGDYSNLNIYRYADMLLLLAEAENQLNANGVSALQIINQFRTARMLPPVDMTEFGATIDEREDFILEERRFELVGEGKRWWDLRRTDKVIDYMQPILDTYPVDIQDLTEARLLFPIYNEHLIDNPLLIQNPGY